MSFCPWEGMTQELRDRGDTGNMDDTQPTNSHCGTFRGGVALLFFHLFFCLKVGGHDISYGYQELMKIYTLNLFMLGSKKALGRGFVPRKL